MRQIIAGVRGRAMGRLGGTALFCCTLVLSLFIRSSLAQTPQYPNVFAAISSRPEFGFLLATVNIAGYVDILSDPNLQAVVLAPNSEAFAATLNNFVGAVAFATQPVPAGLVLSYHVLPTSAAANPVLNLTNGLTLPTNLTNYNNATFQAATLANVTFKLLGNNQVYAGGLGPGGTFFTNTSITAGKSRIYTVSGGLMIPPSKVLTVNDPPLNLTISEALANSANFSTLLALINADPVLKAFVTDPDQAVTLFAPTNAALEAAQSEQDNTATNNFLTPGSASARRVVLNHIVPLRPFSSRYLPVGSTTLPTASSEAGDVVVVTSTGGANPNVTVRGTGNALPLDTVSLRVTIANISAGKSVIHAIPFLILPTLFTNPPDSLAPPSPPPPPPSIAPSPSPSVLGGGSSFSSITDALQQLGLTVALQVANTAGLSSTLSDPKQTLTFLAPSNAAFTAALKTFPAISSQLTNATFAGLIMLYHFIPLANLRFTDGETLPTLLSSQQLTSLSANTVSNVTLKFVQPGTIVYAGGVIPGGVFDVAKRYNAGNSYIYVVDGLLVPPSNVLGANTALTLNNALSLPSLSTLAALIRGDKVLLDLANNPDLAVTVFAPTDEAFTTFLNNLGVTAASLIGTFRARRIVLNHIVPQRPYSSASLPAGVVNSAQAGDSLDIARTPAGNPLVITVRGQGNAAPIKTGATLDVPAGKSVVHLMSGVILPDESRAAPPSEQPIPSPPPPFPPPPSPQGAEVARASTWLLTALLGVGLLLAMMDL